MRALSILLTLLPAMCLGQKAVSARRPQGSEYVGSQKCSLCHGGIYRSFTQTAMGRSISAVTPDIAAQLHLPASYDEAKFGRHYDVFAQDGKVFQSESGFDAGGKELFREQHPFAWIIGSGANVIGGIVVRSEYLFEAPLGLYTETGRWEPAPGYEFADLGFSRPILAGCLYCHSGRSNPVAGTSGRFERDVFSEAAIGCENCHGPGAAHVRAMSGAAGPRAKDAAIVNPARLPSILANDICMGCHESGDERILQPGKQYRDIRPGTPLDEVLTILKSPPVRGSPQADHLQHSYSMMLSKCYRASGGALRCITCHDPHVQPTAQQAPAYFDAKCLSCHSERSCKRQAQERTTGDDCIGCHMPKRTIGFIAHSSLTNHRIVAEADEPLPETAYADSSQPKLIHLDPAPGKEDVAPPDLTLLQAYGELAAYRPEYVGPYLAVLDRLAAKQPENALVQAALGRRSLRAGETRQAIQHLQRSLAIGPPQAVVYADLGEALAKTGEPRKAQTMLQEAIDREPFNPIFRRSMVGLLLQTKQYTQAQAAMTQYLEIFPQDSYMREKFAAAIAGQPAK